MRLAKKTDVIYHQLLRGDIDERTRLCHSTQSSDGHQGAPSSPCLRVLLFVLILQVLKILWCFLFTQLDLCWPRKKTVGRVAERTCLQWE